MKHEGRFLKILISVFLIVGFFFSADMVLSADVPRMTKEELKANLENEDVIILDVRLDYDWAKSDHKIMGAYREDPDSNILEWSTKYPRDKILVLYCG
jgi:hypothetical protein